IKKVEDECLLLEREEKEEARRLELIEKFTDFTQRMKVNMSTLSFEERKQVVRLLVEEVIVNTKTEEVTVRHIMPLDQQFPLCTGGIRLDPRRSPERVFERHPFDQLTNLLVDLRTADRRLGLPSPVELESLPMPFDDGLRFDNDQDLPPILAELRENQHEEALGGVEKNHQEEWTPPMQLGPVNFPVEDGQLLAQREILRHERCSWRDQAPDEQKESGDEDHKCEANHRKKDEPDDRAEWLMISLTASSSRRDEVFGRDRDGSNLLLCPRGLLHRIWKHSAPHRPTPDASE